MFEKVLVPLDGTPFAEEALPVALSVAERSAAEVHLVSVVPLRPPLRVSGARESEEAYVKAWTTDKRERAQEYLRGLEERLREAGYGGPLRTEVLSGGAVETLDGHVRDRGVDLVVMTSHARGAVQRAWLGSVADGLVRRGPCPILLWRPEKEEGPDLADRPAFRRILVPMDGSERSAAVGPHAAALARAFEARLALVAVAPPAGPDVSAYPVMAPLEYEREIAREAENLRERLDEAAEELAGEVGTPVDVDVVKEPDPADGILAHRERLGADAIALSTRGHGAVARMVLGSVADKVVRGGRVPVLVHRPPVDEEE